MTFFMFLMNHKHEETENKVEEEGGMSLIQN